MNLRPINNKEANNQAYVGHIVGFMFTDNASFLLVV